MTIIALAGNPNAGKSTLFNALTGSHQHVGNWPGKTVERKEGRLRLDAQQVTIVDLPGTYSLNAYSVEEIIARDFIIHDAPQAVLAVVDSANLERNLYLVLQVLETGAPVMLALNMADIAEGRGIVIDRDKLSQKLGGAPVMRTVGYQSAGLEDIRQAIAITVDQPATERKPFIVPLPGALEREVATLTEQIAAIPALTERYAPRWLAVKLLEFDEDIQSKLADYPTLIAAAEEAAERVLDTLGDDPDTLVAEARYELIAQWVAETVKRPATNVLTASDKLDRVLTHRVWGLPIFFVLMWVVFQITANVSAPMLDWVDGVVGGPITNWMTAFMTALALEGTWFGALMVDGVVAGVGGVLVFVPVLISLYLAIAVLEDSGYMARAAFVMDRAMHAMGLQGKSFLPLLVGFGCTVPAVYATRTLENETDRKITGFLTTFMSCGARLPVYVLFGAIFFGGSGTFIFAMYLTGIAVAVLTSFLLTRLVFREKVQTPFVMELPPYRTPNPVVIWRSTWERTGSFIRNAGTIILAASIIIWLMMAIPATGEGEFNDVAAQDSVFGTVSEGVSPVFAPAGFGNWEASGALITGFIAKEVVVASMAQIYVGEEDAAADEPTPTFTEDVTGIVTSFGDALIITAQELVNIVPRTVNLIPGVTMAEADFMGAGAEEEADESGLHNAVQNAFTPLAAVAFNIFILLYMPCMAAFGAMRHEFGWRWALTQAAYTLGIAWLAAVAVFQIGTLIGV
ncbi:MAG: ferrous iron transport protein B [Anaerolineales bacterium]